MQGLADVLITLVSWAVVVVTFPRLKKHEKSSLYLWLFLVFFAISFTFQIDSLYVTIDAALPINNLTWWLSYVAVIIALAFLVDACSSLADTPTPPVKLLSTLAIFGTGFIYVFYLSRAPESLGRDYPRSTAEVVYIAIVHVYDVIMLWFGPVLAFRKMVRAERLLPGRMRVSLFLIVAILGLTWQVLKLVRIVFIIPFGQHPLVLFLPKLFPLLLGGVAIALLLGFLPKRLYSNLGIAIERVLATSALLQSRWFALQLEPIWRPLALASVPLGIQLRQPSLYLRRQIYYILDCRKALAVDEDAGYAHPLYRALRALPQTGDYEETVRECCRISRHLFIRSLFDRLSASSPLNRRITKW